jgi:O-antigen ligase
MELIVFIIFLTRSCTDAVFETLQFGVGGMNLSPGAILNLVVLGLGIMTLLKTGSSFPFKVWLPFLIVAASSVVWSSDKGLAIRMLLVLVCYASLFAIPFYLRKKFRSNVWLLKAMIYSSILPATVGVLEYLFFLRSSGRVFSTFDHPNVFAFYLSVIVGAIFFLLSSSLVEFKPFMRKMIIPYAGLLLGLIVLTQTRSAWFGVLLILAAFALFRDRRYLLLLLLLPMLLFVPAVSDRLDDLGHGTEFKGEIQADDEINSFAWRTLMWQSALEDAADTPFFGKGLSSFGSNALRFFPLADLKDGYTIKGIGAHSAYVQAGYETGLVGLACYLSIFFRLIFRARRYFRRDPGGTLMLISIILCYMSESFSDNMFDYGSVNLYFWGLLGIVFAKWELESAEARTAPSRSAYRGGRQRIGASV